MCDRFLPLTNPSAAPKKPILNEVKIEVVSAIKRTVILKYTLFYIIPYIHSPEIWLFSQILMATKTTFPGTNWVE